MGHGKNLLKCVVEVLYDSERGLAELSRCMRDAQFATFFKHESETRGTYARRIEMIASLLDAVTEDNSARHYWEFMAVSKEDSDETLLAIAREGEGVTTKAYHNALTELSLAPAVRRLLEEQQSHIGISGRLVGSFREPKAA